MKTRTIFLSISIIMLVLEVILGYYVFKLNVNWVEELSMILMISLTIVITVIMFHLYKDEKAYEKV